MSTTGKAENAVQVTKAIQDIKNHPISSQTVCCNLEKSGMKAMVKKKCPLLSKCHRKERLDFTMVGNGCGKRQERVLVTG
ncbi:hypothetical protein PAXRUDRAFT_768132 [Paxillus rubicundulus Ve08.2h10]|uniref:Transposase Tc1-like domain-containing protein n=1 Tax=Paxillus rubicundulus Ve08.2h10 TaxID=930991 RepID=A0A0D0CW75_9AGAM|nr:hypothetical protein PAXRUDRAFT_768132 [Paxillus rubicundulus Ve08.2h10]